MTDNIVARLREICGNELWGEAASEIERLRKENNDLREIVSLQGEVVKLAQRRHKERDEAQREVDQLRNELRQKQELISKHALDVIARIDEEIQDGS